MANKQEKQRETVSFIHTAKAFADKIAPFMILKGNLDSGNAVFGANPMRYLLGLLNEVGVSRKELEEYISNIILLGIPALELSVKAIILTNLKKMVSCSVDPRIPYKYRKRHKSSDTSNEHGIDIDLEAIDIFDKLSLNPLSEEGENAYFGNKDAKSSYEFVRAEDFDAFLWFVMHKGKFPVVSTISGKTAAWDSSVANSTLLDNNHGYGSGWSVSPSDATLHVDFTLERNNVNQPATCIPGNAFSYGGISDTGKKVISICDKVWYDENGKINKSEIVPVSDDNVSVNWYKCDTLSMVANMTGVDSSRFKANVNKKTRPICNLQYIECAADGTEDKHTGFANSKFRFSILPKPDYHIPNITTDYLSPFTFKPYRLEGHGDYDMNGPFTVPDDKKSNIQIDKLGKVTVLNKPDVIKNLYPCYGGLTVYEFNFDYLMGMRLFDAKCIAWELVEAVMNTSIGLEVSWESKHAEMTAMAREIVKSIIDEDDDVEINDCHFLFDNSKYDELIRRAQEKRARMENFGNGATPSADLSDVKNIFKEYDENASLEEKRDVLNRVFSRVSASVTESVGDRDGDKVGLNIVSNYLEQLAFVLMKAIMSPKVMMLLYVNKELMGGFGTKNPSFNDILKEMKSIVASEVKEIVDMIIAELLKLLIDKLSPLMSLMSDLLIKEAMKDYTDLLNQIMQLCSFSFCNRKGEGNTILDNVDYADIDNPPRQPNTTNC